MSRHALHTHSTTSDPPSVSSDKEHYILTCKASWKSCTKSKCIFDQRESVTTGSR